MIQLSPTSLQIMATQISNLQIRIRKSDGRFSRFRPLLSKKSWSKSEPTVTTTAIPTPQPAKIEIETPRSSYETIVETDFVDSKHVIVIESEVTSGSETASISETLIDSPVRSDSGFDIGTVLETSYGSVYGSVDSLLLTPPQDAEEVISHADVESHDEEPELISYETPEPPTIVITDNDQPTPKKQRPSEIHLGALQYLAEQSLLQARSGNFTAAEKHLKRLYELDERGGIYEAVQSRIYSLLLSDRVDQVEQGSLFEALDQPLEIKTPDSEFLMVQLQLDTLNRFYSGPTHPHRKYYSSIRSTLEDAKRIVESWSFEIPDDRASKQTDICEKKIQTLELKLEETLAKEGYRILHDGRHRALKGVLREMYRYRHIEAANELALTSARRLLRSAQNTKLQAKSEEKVTSMIQQADLLFDIILNPSILSAMPGPKFDPMPFKETSYCADRQYKASPFIPADILEIRANVLTSWRDLFGSMICESLKKEDWNRARIRLLSYRNFDLEHALKIIWPDKQSLDVELVADDLDNKPIPKDMLVVAYYIFVQDALAQYSTERGIFKRIEEHYDLGCLTPDFRFLLYLTRAKIAYFQGRDLETVLVYCQEAVKLGGCEAWGCPKADAHYLYARVLTRKGDYSDAEYYYSLLPEDYSPWRVYGHPGFMLKRRGIGISKGEIDIDSDTLAEILQQTIQYEDSDEIVGLLADDVKWMSRRLKLDVPQGKLRGNALHYFAAQGDIFLTKLTLNNPWVDVNQRDAIGRTPLHWAAACLSKEVLKPLIEHGADLEATDNTGATPLHLLLRTNYTYTTDEKFLECLETFLEYGPDAFALDNEDATPLHTLTKVLRTQINDWNAYFGYNDNNGNGTDVVSDGEVVTSTERLRAKYKMMEYREALDVLLLYAFRKGNAYVLNQKDAEGNVAFDLKLYEELLQVTREGYT